MEIRASRTAKEGGRVCTDIFVSSARSRRRRKPIWVGRGLCQRHTSQRARVMLPLRRWTIKKILSGFQIQDRLRWMKHSEFNSFLWISECRKLYSITLLGQWKVSCPISYRAMLICSTLDLKSLIRWNRTIWKLLYWSKSSDFQSCHLLPFLDLSTSPPRKLEILLIKDVDK